MNLTWKAEEDYIYFVKQKPDFNYLNGFTWEICVFHFEMKTLDSSVCEGPRHIPSS